MQSGPVKNYLRNSDLKKSRYLLDEISENGRATVASDSLGPLEFQIVSVLLEQPRNAYGISIDQRLRERTGRNRSLAAIYATLDRLEKKGMVRSWWGEPTAERGGRRKRYYEVTALGAVSSERMSREYRPRYGASQQESEA
jgi:PadR family transcriptional regulator